MASKLFALLRQQWMGALALFLVLTGGTAYAAGTVGSAAVIDNSLLSADLKDNAAVRSADVQDDTSTGGGLQGIDIRPSTLTGADINESSLSQVPDAGKLDGLDS